MGTDPDRGNSELNAASAAHNSVSADGRTNRTDVEPEAFPRPQFNALDADSLAHAPFDLASFPDEGGTPEQVPVPTFRAPAAVAAVRPADTAVLRLPNGLIVRTTRRSYQRRRSARRVLLAVDAAAADLVLALHQATRRLQTRGRIVLAKVDTKRLLTRTSVPRVAVIAAVSLVSLGGLVYFSRANAPAVTGPPQVAQTAPPAPRAQLARADTATAPAAQVAPAARAIAPAPAAPVNPPATSHVRKAAVAATTGERPAKAAKSEPRRSVETTPTVGALNITSQPAGAQVSVNGVRHGQTPVVIRGLRAGSRVVSLSLPGYERWSWSVAVVADKLTPVNVKLQRRDAPSALRH
jgi:hypothetical protein